MAASYIFGKLIGVYVDMSDTATPDFKLVTCTTQKSFDLSVDTVDLNNDCTGVFSGALPTTASWTMGVEGDANFNPELSEISAEELFTIAKEREIRNWKFENADSSYVRFGQAFLTGYSESATSTEYLTFSATLNGVGEIYSSIPS